MEFEEMNYFPEEENDRWDYVRNLVSWLRVVIVTKDDELKNIKNELYSTNKRVEEHDWLIKERFQLSPQNVLGGTERVESVNTDEEKFAAMKATMECNRDSTANKMAETKDSLSTEVDSMPSSFTRSGDTNETELENSATNFNSESAAGESSTHSLFTEASADDRVFRLVNHYTIQMDNLLARMESLQFGFEEALMRQEHVVLDIVQHFEDRLTTAENDVHSLTFQLQGLEDSILSSREELVKKTRARSNDLRDFVEDQLSIVNAHCDVTRTMATKTAGDLSRINEALHWHEECCRDTLKALEKDMTCSEHLMTSRMGVVSSKMGKLENSLDNFVSERRSMETRIASRLERHLGGGVAKLVERSVEEERVEMVKWIDQQLMDRLHQNSPLVLTALAKRDWDDAYFELQATLRTEIRRGENRVVCKMEAGLGDVVALLANQKSTMEEIAQMSARAGIKMATRVEGLDDAVKVVFRKLESEMEAFRNEKDELVDEYYRVVDVVNGIRMDRRFEEVDQRVGRIRDTVNGLGDQMKNYHAKLMILDDSVNDRMKLVDRKLKVVEDSCTSLADDQASLKNDELNQMQVRFETIHCNCYLLENKIEVLNDVIRTVEDNCTMARLEDAESAQSKMAAMLDEKMAADHDRGREFEDGAPDDERCSSKCAAVRKKVKTLQKTVDAVDKKMESRFQSFESKLTAISPKEKQKSKHKK